MALAEDESLPHGLLELLVTVDEQIAAPERARAGSTLPS
jgi:hypothetical protein